MFRPRMLSTHMKTAVRAADLKTDWMVGGDAGVHRPIAQRLVVQPEKVQCDISPHQQPREVVRHNRADGVFGEVVVERLEYTA